MRNFEETPKDIEGILAGKQQPDTQTITEELSELKSVIRIMQQHRQTRDDTNSTQQPDVEENHNSRYKRRRSNSTSTDSEDDIRHEKNRKSKSYKSVNDTTHENNSNENDKISVCADELGDGNIFELIDNDKTETNASSTNDTLQQLAEIFDDSESTRNDIKPHFANHCREKEAEKTCS